MREAEIEEVLHRRFIDATSLPFTVIDRQVQLPGRRRVDLLAEAQDKGLWAIELKAGQMVPPDVGQLLGYLPLLRGARGRDAQPMLMAPSIRPDAAVLAARPASGSRSWTSCTCCRGQRPRIRRGSTCWRHCANRATSTVSTWS